jgi:hypothetical protein
MHEGLMALDIPHGPQAGGKGEGTGEEREGLMALDIPHGPEAGGMGDKEGKCPNIMPLSVCL